MEKVLEKKRKFEIAKIVFSISFFMVFTALTGCGKEEDSALSAYKVSMSEFYDKLAEYDNSINSINPDSDSAKEELLGYLDQMNDTYKAMGDLKVPNEFSGIADLATEAKDYMQKANDCYHKAYDGEFDEESLSLASQYYERANKRAFIMLQVLHGENPSDDSVSVTTEDAYQFATIDDDEGAEESEETEEMIEMESTE
jgi:hypothetical protein